MRHIKIEAPVENLGPACIHIGKLMVHITHEELDDLRAKLTEFLRTSPACLYDPDFFASEREASDWATQDWTGEHDCSLQAHIAERLEDDE